MGLSSEPIAAQSSLMVAFVGAINVETFGMLAKEENIGGSTACSAYRKPTTVTLLLRVNTRLALGSFSARFWNSIKAWKSCEFNALEYSTTLYQTFLVDAVYSVNAVTMPVRHELV